MSKEGQVIAELEQRLRETRSALYQLVGGGDFAADVERGVELSMGAWKEWRDGRRLFADLVVEDLLAGQGIPAGTTEAGVCVTLGVHVAVSKQLIAAAVAIRGRQADAEAHIRELLRAPLMQAYDRSVDDITQPGFEVHRHAVHVMREGALWGVLPAERFPSVYRQLQAVQALAQLEGPAFSQEWARIAFGEPSGEATQRAADDPVEVLAYMPLSGYSYPEKSPRISQWVWDHGIERGYQRYAETGQISLLFKDGSRIERTKSSRDELLEHARESASVNPHSFVWCIPVAERGYADDDTAVPSNDATCDGATLDCEGPSP